MYHGNATFKKVGNINYLSQKNPDRSVSMFYVRKGWKLIKTLLNFTVPQQNE